MPRRGITADVEVACLRSAGSIRLAGPKTPAGRLVGALCGWANLFDVVARRIDDRSIIGDASLFDVVERT